MSNFKKTAQKLNAKMSAELKLHRAEQRYTMRALADKLGTPHSFIGKTEQQNRRLDVGEFIQYCRALDVNPLDIFKTVLKHHVD